MRTVQRQARLAGLLYLLIVITAPFGLMVAPGRLVVARDAVATAANLRDAAWILRLGIASELVHQVIGLFLALALYRLFEPVDIGLSRQLVVLGALVSVPIVFLNVLNELAALTLVSGADYLAVFAPPQLDALVYLFLRLHGQGIVVASVFWGLWLFPFGLLVIRSGFIPRILGYLLFVAGTAYLASAAATLFLPQIAPLVSRVALPLEVCELPIVAWLLVWGARPRAAPAETPAEADRPRPGSAGRRASIRATDETGLAGTLERAVERRSPGILEP